MASIKALLQYYFWHVQRTSKTPMQTEQSGMGEGDEVTDIMSPVLQCFESHYENFFFPPIYIWGITGILTSSVMNYNTLEKNTQKKNVHLNNITTQTVEELTLRSRIISFQGSPNCVLLINIPSLLPQSTNTQPYMVITSFSFRPLPLSTHLNTLIQTELPMFLLFL